MRLSSLNRLGWLRSPNRRGEACPTIPNRSSAMRGTSPTSCAGRDLRPADAAAIGTDLSAVGRLQPPALRSRRRQAGRLSQANSARALHYCVAGHAILRTRCDYDPWRLTGMKARFSAPVFPGETIRTEMWQSAGGVTAFRSRVVERDVVVLDQGVAMVCDWTICSRSDSIPTQNGQRGRQAITQGPSAVD